MSPSQPRRRTPSATASGRSEGCRWWRSQSPGVGPVGAAKVSWAICPAVRRPAHPARPCAGSETQPEPACSRYDDTPGANGSRAKRGSCRLISHLDMNRPRGPRLRSPVRGMWHARAGGRRDECGAGIEDELGWDRWGDLQLSSLTITCQCQPRAIDCPNDTLARPRSQPPDGRRATDGPTTRAGASTRALCASVRSGGGRASVARLVLD